MSGETASYCTFRTAGRLFGISILDVREVTTETLCTRIPHAPDEVAGYVNIRGHIHLALDLRTLLGLPGRPEPVDQRLVLFKSTTGPAFGILVDEIADIVAVASADTEELLPPTGETQVIGRSELVIRVCRLPDELLTILEPRRFLPIVETASNAA